MCAFDDCGDGLPENDEDLLQRVRLSVERSRLHGLHLMDIEVIGDTVVLSGEVATFHHKQLATEFARKVAGVAQVLNHLEVHRQRNDDKPRPLSAVRRRSRADETVDRKQS